MALGWPPAVAHWDYDVALANESISVRVVAMSATGQNLDLDLVMDLSTMYYTNRFQLRKHEWTDPTDGTGYTWVDENLCAGHDTDNDSLPDGWEVDFGLDPRDPGTEAAGWTNGPWGDPDGTSSLIGMNTSARTETKTPRARISMGTAMKPIRTKNGGVPIPRISGGGFPPMRPIIT
jgi:hypothetical protein